MTVKEKLKLMDEVKARNDAKWSRKESTMEIKAIRLTDGETVLITGKWQNIEEARPVLESDGYIIIWYVKG